MKTLDRYKIHFRANLQELIRNTTCRCDILWLKLTASWTEKEGGRRMQVILGDTIPVEYELDQRYWLKAGFEESWTNVENVYRDQVLRDGAAEFMVKYNIRRGVGCTHKV